MELLALAVVAVEIQKEWKVDVSGRGSSWAHGAGR